MKAEVEMEAHRIAEALRDVAIPDSRFDYDFNCFIPGFHGSKHAAKRLRSSKQYQNAAVIFATLEASLWDIRQMALDDGKTVLMPTYGLLRGVYYLRAKDISPSDRALATCLDGVELFGERLSPTTRFDGLPSQNLFICGASAVTQEGVRFGMGSGFIDVEWWIAKSLGVVGAQSPVFSIVHDIQISGESYIPQQNTLTIDQIFTPNRAISCTLKQKPTQPPNLDFVDPKVKNIALISEFFDFD